MQEAAARGAHLNMTYLALSLSTYVNGVAKKHGVSSRQMFPEVPIEAITNGVHAATWVSPPYQQFFDRHIARWREDNYSLRFAHGLAPEQVWHAHLTAKHELIEAVRRNTRLTLDRRRVHALGSPAGRLATNAGPASCRPWTACAEAKNAGHFQVIHAGKAHPNDTGGKEIIQRIFQRERSPAQSRPACLPRELRLDHGGKIAAGVDLWLNTPQPPLEASGTSGMKAALNGVPSLSILDGWWAEGHIEGVTGWSMGEPRRSMDPADVTTDNTKEAEALYWKLENIILPMFYKEPRQYIQIMQHAIAINGSFFNTQRMVQQYITDAYLR